MGTLKDHLIDEESMSEDLLEPEEKVVAGRIFQTFLASGKGNPARVIRIELGKQRGVLDRLVAKRVVRLVGDVYYPLFLAKDAWEPAVREMVERYTALVFETLQALYRERGKNLFVYAEVLDRARVIDPGVGEERVNLGMLMATDFTAYIGGYGLGAHDSPQSGLVTDLTVREAILDYESVDQAWRDEMRHREPKVIPDSLDHDAVAGLPPAAAARPARRDLDPWPVVMSFFSSLSSDQVVAAINATGLGVNWNLTQKENYSHTTRVRAYLPRIQAAADGLPEERRLVVAALAASTLLQIGGERGERLRERLAQIGWQLEGDRLIPTEGTVRELFFPKGSQHDAYVEIRGLLKAAVRTILVIDPYVDGSIFELLAGVGDGPLEIQLLTSKVPDDFRLEARKFMAQHGRFKLEIRLSAEFHDRFIVLDGSTCYHIGASIKDAGRKAFMISRVEDKRNRDALLQQHQQSWVAAKPEGVGPS